MRMKTIFNNTQNRPLSYMPICWLGQKTATNIGLYYGIKVAKDIWFTATQAGMNFIE